MHMMRKSISIFTAMVVILLVCAGNSGAQQMTDMERGNWLLGVVFKLEGMRDDALADIQRHETGIRKADAIISRAENIMSLARQKDNAEAERVARDALMKARDARQKNEELRRQAQLRKKRADIAYADVRNLMEKMSSVKSEIKSVVTNHSGRVYIFRQNGETIPLGEDQAGYLEPGDRVWTLENSSVEMQFLDGRGTLNLGEYSEFRMEKDSAGKQVINMIKGKIHIGVDKLDDYRKMMGEKIRRYKSDAALVKDEVIDRLVEEHENLQERLEKARRGGYHPASPLSLWPFLPGLLMRTPTAVAAVRGTEFLVYEDEIAGTAIIVLEGTVEVKAIKAEKTFLVDAGNRIHVTKDGIASKPEKIDLKKIKRWWE